jgi:uncharacterized membrane protein
MSAKAAITVMRPRSEVERLWHESAASQNGGGELLVRFVDAPGDRGTEIHVELQRRAPFGPVGEAAEKLLGRVPLAKVKDRLRHFKQQVETGVIARSEASPEGESVERKFHERPAQPLDPSELEKVTS